MARARLTNEEKVAKVIVYAVNDLTLDLEEVGEHIAEIANTVLYNRLQVIFEVAEEEVQNAKSHDHHLQKLQKLSM